ncbi:MAG: OmpA family protein [Pseudomonadales bacterium]|jgi:outer membrane protein OmpA-like peptidoglycan-associated protein|nr:OmpA family protein [Pseudomonadales bacterium]
MRLPSLSGTVIGTLAILSLGALSALGWHFSLQHRLAAEARLSALEAQLAAAQAQAQTLLEDNTELLLDVARRDRALDAASEERLQLLAQAKAQPAPVLCCLDGRVLLHFQGGSSAIENFYDAELTDFANAVRTLPGATVEISGYADRSSERETALELSQERVHAVRERLRALGLSEVDFYTSANGAATPLAQGATRDEFFERRVELRLVDSGAQQISLR